jgi:hypothetical protein
MASLQLTDARISLISPLTQMEPTNEEDGRSAPSPEASRLWDEVIDSLLRVRKLEDDWDGQGAVAPAVANVDSSIDWVRQMRRYTQAIPPSQVAPGVTGEVLLVWQEKSFYLEAEISEPDRVEWMLAVSGQPNKHWVTDRSVPYFVGSRA